MLFILVTGDFQQLHMNLTLHFTFSNFSEIFRNALEITIILYLDSSKQKN